MTTTHDTDRSQRNTLLPGNQTQRPERMRAADDTNDLQRSPNPAPPQSFVGSLIYLLLGVPLGALSFTVVMIGVTLGIGLMPLALLGIPTTIGFWHISRMLMRLERNLANALLGAHIDSVLPVPHPAGGMWQQFKIIINDRYGWKGLLYLVLRFPVGILTFIVSVTLVALSLSLTLAPTYMWAGDNREWLGQWFDSYLWSFALVPLGIIVSFTTIYLTRTLGNVLRRWVAQSLSAPS